ncbi:uncharacterized protein Dvar_45530 [Desulfosarcina variabilis str. Montpellier]
MLEHIPYEESLQAFKEMGRVAKKHVLISLPDAKIQLVLSLDAYMLSKKIKIKKKIIHIPFKRINPKIHRFDGEHYWEIDQKGYSLQKIINDFTTEGIKLKKTYRVNENPYHRFFVFEKNFKC